eukprot:6467025-Amphidinium_carterae.3
MHLHGTRQYKLHLRVKTPRPNEPYIEAYSDSDWAGCQTTRKSTAGVVPQFAGVTISRSSKTQQTIAQLSAGAELHSIGTTVNYETLYTNSNSHKMTD